MTIILEQEVPQSSFESYIGIKNIRRHKIYECDTAYVDLVVYKDKYYIVATYFDNFDSEQTYTNSSRKTLIIYCDTDYIIRLYSKIVTDNKIDLIQGTIVKWAEYGTMFSYEQLDRFNREHDIE